MTLVQSDVHQVMITPAPSTRHNVITAAPSTRHVVITELV